MERFEHTLLSSHLHKEPNYGAIHKKFDTLKCTPFPSIADIEYHITDFENLVQTLRVHNMLDDYPETRLAQKLFDDLSDHVQWEIYLMTGDTPVNPKDPTGRKNYAATKDDLLHLIQSSYGKHKIERVYNHHLQTLTHTIVCSFFQKQCLFLLHIHERMKILGIRKNI